MNPIGSGNNGWQPNQQPTRPPRETSQQSQRPARATQTPPSTFDETDMSLLTRIHGLAERILDPRNLANGTSSSTALAANGLMSNELNTSRSLINTANAQREGIDRSLLPGRSTLLNLIGNPSGEVDEVLFFETEAANNPHQTADLPTLPSCSTLDLSNCANLTTLPRLPFFARLLFSDADQHNPIPPKHIDLDRLEENPKHYILEIGYHLLNYSQLPFVIYFQHGDRCNGIDHGGLGRDLFSRLFKGGFKIQENGSDAINTKNYLILDKDRNPKSVGETNEEDYYRAIGRLLKLCLPKGSMFKTGPRFSETVYECIKCAMSDTFDQFDKENEDWFVYTLLKFKNFPENLIYKIQYDPNNFDEKEYGFIMGLINEFVDMSIDDIEKTKSFMSIKQNRYNLRSSILTSAKENQSLRLIFAMASEIQKGLSPDLKRHLSELTLNQFIETIEGRISNESVKENLVWPSINDSQTRQFLENWIDAADKESLRKFVYSISSLNTLATKKFTMIVTNSHSKLPEASTCSYALKLSSWYKDQAEFNQRMNQFLEYALLGTGFQIE